jgi:hypothetical protein
MKPFLIVVAALLFVFVRSETLCDPATAIYYQDHVKDYTELLQGLIDEASKSK